MEPKCAKVAGEGTEPLTKDSLNGKYSTKLTDSLSESRQVPIHEMSECAALLAFADAVV